MSEPNIQTGFISRSTKLWLWFIAWGGTALLALVLPPAHPVFAPFFPIGLLALLPHGEEEAIIGWMLMFPVALGWLAYLVYSLVMLKRRKTSTFFIMYFVFCVVLALNVVGCRRTVEAANGIH